MLNLKTINTSTFTHSSSASVLLLIMRFACLSPFPYHDLKVYNHSYTGLCCMQSSLDHISLSWGRAGPALCELSRGLSTQVGGDPGAQRLLLAQPLSAVALAGAGLRGDELCLILTLMLELLGASVDLCLPGLCPQAPLVILGSSSGLAAHPVVSGHTNHPAAVTSEVTSSSSCLCSTLLMLPR